MDVVITRFNENIDWVCNIPYPMWIYNKGLPHLKQNVIQHPNFGREADVMLHHIIQRYNCLSETTAFLQANPFDHCWDALKLLDKHQNTDDVIWLGSNWSKVTKRFDGGPGNGSSFLQLEMCHLLFNNCAFDTNTMFTFSAGAQYIVPKKFILNKSLNWWMKTHNIFKSFFFLEPEGSRNSTAWIFERIWPLIWNYTDTDTIY